MTDTKFNNDEFLTIDWSEVQKGDILMNPENGDRLTVEDVAEVIDTRTVVVAGGHIASYSLERRGFTPHRPVPPLDAVPDTPGAYLDKDGVLCVLTGDPAWPWKGDALDVDAKYFDSNEMRHRAPFTRLVPMPTEDQVREAIEEALENGFGPEPQDATAAVMSLLSGEANSTGEES